MVVHTYNLNILEAKEDQQFTQGYPPQHTGFEANLRYLRPYYF